MRHQTTNGYENYILGGYKPLRCYPYIGLNNLGFMDLKHKTFVATIFETDQVFQDVICYLDNWYDDGTADVRIGLPLYVKPTDLINDVRFWLYDEYGMKLNKLTYEIAPQQTYIAP